MFTKTRSYGISNCMLKDILFVMALGMTLGCATSVLPVDGKKGVATQAEPSRIASVDEAHDVGDGPKTLAQLPQETVTIAADGEHMIAWGMVELPEKTRLQIAYTMADAAARSELAVFLRAQVSERMNDFESATQTRIEFYSREQASARIAGGVMKHYTMPRGSRVLTLSRLHIHKDDIIAAFSPADRAWVRAVLAPLKPEKVQP